MNNIELDTKVKQLMPQITFEKGFVNVVDVMMQLNYLSEKDYNAWLKGQIEYLERVCKVNLSKLTLVSNFTRKYSNELDLKPKMNINLHLRYSKSNNKTIENSYATVFVDFERCNQLKKK